MRTLANESTADQLLDYVANDGAVAEWTRYADFADWQSLYNLWGQRGFVGRLAQNLAGRRQELRRRGQGGRGSNDLGRKGGRIDHAGCARR